MEENLSSPEDLESDFDEERSDESEPGDSDGEGPGMLEVPSRLSFTRSCSQYSSSSAEETGAATKVRRRRRRRRRGGQGGVSGSSHSHSQKSQIIEEAVKAGDRDRLSQLAVSEGGLLSDEVRELGLMAPAGQSLPGPCLDESDGLAQAAGDKPARNRHNSPGRRGNLPARGV